MADRHFCLTDEQNRRYKKRMGMFAGIGFVAGIVLANTLFRKTIIDMGIFGDYFFKQMSRVKIDGSSMFWYVFEKRMLWVLAVLVCSLTSCGIVAVYLNCAWLGSGAGILLSAAAMQQGIEGIAMCVAGLLPQYLFYVPAAVWLLMRSCRLCETLHGKSAVRGRRLKSEWMFALVSLGGVVLVFLPAMLLESYLNPVFLQKIYKLFHNI